jgi:hypothetical protein
MAFRQICGALLIALIGIPILFGVTWAVGLVKASVSAEFLTDLPREIIDGIPRTADDIFLALQDEKLVSDPAVRAWFQAAAKTGTSPRDLMEKTGILSWMRGSLSDSLRQVGEVLRGESPVLSISLDMRPLKAALFHPEMERYFEGILANLPPCDEPGLAVWKDLAAGMDNRHDLPACSPDPVIAKAAFTRERARAVGDMDDSVQILEDLRPFPFQRFGISKAITFLSYLLFLIPAFVIFLGVLIGDKTPAGRLRWSGISVLAGGVPVLVLALGIKTFALWALGGHVFSWHEPMTSDVGQVILSRLSWIPSHVVEAFFTPVIWTAAVVGLVGVVLLALSASARTSSPTVAAPAAPKA